MNDKGPVRRRRGLRRIAVSWEFRTRATATARRWGSSW